jgi:Prenyltransferase and squalene oxidase repeat
MATSPLSFVTRWLLDREAGGVFSAADPTGQVLLTTDKHLPDQASVVLALAPHASDGDVRVAVKGLLRMQDRRGTPGFTEFTDRSWRPYPVGRVRTVRFQLHAATALLAAAHRLDIDDLRVRAIDLLNRCLGLARDGNLPSRLTEDWRAVVHEPPTPQTLVSAVRALWAADAAGETSVDSEGLTIFARRLAEAADIRPGQQITPDLRRCGASARIALALAQAGRMLDSTEYMRSAERILTMVAERFLDQGDGGFWNRLAPDGSVCVDWIEAPRRGEQPFPIKKAADAAQLLQAALLLKSSGVQCDDVIEQCRSTIAWMTDAHHGGVFLGVGYEWVTMRDPGPPSVRLIWTPPRQPDGIIDGGRGGLSLAQKSAHAQASVVRAVGVDPDSANQRRARQRKRLATTARHGPRRSTPALMRAGHLLGARGDVRWPAHARISNWVAPGARWALERVSEAAGTWRMSHIFHMLAELRVLGNDRPLPPALVTHLRESQNDDGGFGERPGDSSDVFATYYAVLALHLAREHVARPEAAGTYLRGCQGPDGTFGAVPGMLGNVWHTHAAVAALHMLGTAPDAVDDCARSVRASRSSNGGYANRPGQRANVLFTMRALATLWLLGKTIPEPAVTVQALQACQMPGGGFTHHPGHAATVMATHHTASAMRLLGGEPIAREACERWLVSRLDIDRCLGYGDGTPKTAADSFACVQAIALLRGALSAEWAALVL